MNNPWQKEIEEALQQAFEKGRREGYREAINDLHELICSGSLNNERLKEWVQKGLQKTL